VRSRETGEIRGPVSGSATSGEDRPHPSLETSLPSPLDERRQSTFLTPDSVSAARPGRPDDPPWRAPKQIEFSAGRIGRSPRIRFLQDHDIGADVGGQGAPAGRSSVRAIAGKAPWHRWHLRQRRHCPICNLQNLKEARESESHSLRQTSLALRASFVRVALRATLSASRLTGDVCPAEVAIATKAHLLSSSTHSAPPGRPGRAAKAVRSSPRSRYADALRLRARASPRYPKRGVV
jgi:hypothetical protein